MGLPKLSVAATASVANFQTSISTKLSSTTRGAYVVYAIEAALAGLVILPAKNKKPLLKGWARLRSPPRISTIERMMLKFREADWGFIPAASDMVVVDWDEDDLPAALRVFGVTPFIVKTRRGYHLYYRKRGGVAATDLQAIGISAQIKSRRSLVMGWGSLTSSGTPYRIHCGNLNDLKTLPEFDVAALEKLTAKSIDDDQEKPRVPGTNTDGRRRALFAHARMLGAQGKLSRSNPDAGIALLAAFNEQYNSPPCECSYVERTFWQAVHYVESGQCKPPRHVRNFRTITRQEQQILLAKLDLRKFDFADAYTLFAMLKGQHGLRSAGGDPFAIASKAMARAGVIPGWSHKKYQKSTRALLSVNLITRSSCASTIWCKQTDREVIGRVPAFYQFVRV